MLVEDADNILFCEEADSDAALARISSPGHRDYRETS